MCVGIVGNASRGNSLCNIDKSCYYDLETLSGSPVASFNISSEHRTGSSYSFLYRILPKRGLDEDAGDHNDATEFQN